MCKNNTRNSKGTSCRDNRRDNHHHHKEHKKMPKRGRGVGQLEKMLRDQENKSDHQQQSFLTNINPTNINSNSNSLTTDMNHVSLLPLNMVLPNNSLWPSSSSLMLNKQFYQSQLHSKINHHISPVSASSNSLSSSSIQPSPNQILEPPSSFASHQYYYPPIVLEEQKVVDKKRRLVSITVENIPSPVVQYQVPSTIQHMQKPDESFFYKFVDIYNKLQLSKTTMPREAQRDGPLKPMINFQNFSTESGGPDFNGGHFNRFVPPTVVSQSLQTFDHEQRVPNTHDYIPLFQGCMVETDTQSSCRSNKEKPIYSFMQVKEQGTKEKPICIDIEAEDESSKENGIDLKLKL